MRKRKVVYLLIFCLLALVLVLRIVFEKQKDSVLEVIFLNVRQGDAILISQGSNQILIDGGRDGQILLEKLGRYVPFWDRTIETVIQTHPDQDHVGGLVKLFQAYRVQTVLKTAMPNDSQTVKKLAQVVEQNGTQSVEAKNGTKLVLPNGAQLEILFPLSSVTDFRQETNATSVVAKLIFGDNKFLFTGDLPSEQETEFLSKKSELSADVLKVSHHGSKYATSDEFLIAIGARDAVISVGKNNMYGHPNPELLQRLSMHKLNVYRTDEQGDIVYQCPSPNDKCQVKFAR